MIGGRVRWRAWLVAVIVSLSVLSAITVLHTHLPPANVVESGSMQHGNIWMPNTINTGDILLEKKVSNPIEDVVTYVQGRSTNFSTYGDYGNVIFYKAPDNLSIVHRAMFYLTWSGHRPVVLGYQGQSWININGTAITIDDVGYSHRNLVVDTSGFVGESGFITMGDNNLATSVTNSTSGNAFFAVDQNVFNYPPINSSSVLGIAYGDIPWAGLIKLNVMKAQGEWNYSYEVPQFSYLFLILTMAGLIAIPTAIAIHIYRNENKKGHGKY